LQLFIIKYVIKEFIKAYDDVADKDSIDIRAIIDGIVDEIADTDDADDDDDYDDIIDEKDEDFDESDSDDEDYD
jgi:ribonuclease E